MYWNLITDLKITTTINKTHMRYMKKQDKAMVLSTSNRIGTIILYLMHIFNVFVLIYKGSRKTLQ